MSFHRATLAALAALFVVGTASYAFAGCCDFAPCGGCGAPVAAPVTYVAPVAPVPVAAPPVVATPVATAAWGIGGCGCGRPVVYAAPPVAVEPIIVPAPIYVVDQGPAYTGPGIMVTYRTWSPAAAYAPEIGFPYVAPLPYGYALSGYGYASPTYGYPSPAYGYGPPRRHYAYMHFHHYYPVRHWHYYPHRPLRARD